MLNPTPDHLLLDSQGRPYFLWDCDLTDQQFRDRLNNPDKRVRAYLLGKLMRQAKPDDVFRYTTTQRIREHWDLLLPYLGRTREFWTWIFERWETQGHV